MAGSEKSKPSYCQRHDESRLDSRIDEEEANDRLHLSAVAYQQEQIKLVLIRLDLAEEWPFRQLRCRRLTARGGH